MLEKMKEKATEKAIDFRKNIDEKMGDEMQKIVKHGNVFKGLKDDFSNKRFDRLKTNLFGRFFNHKEAVEDCLNTVMEVSGRRDTINDPSVPEDVVDNMGSWIVTKDGFSVLGRILPKQIHSGSQTPIMPFFTILLALAVVFYKLDLQTISIIFGGLFIYTWLLPNGIPSFKFNSGIIISLGIFVVALAIGFGFVQRF